MNNLSIIGGGIGGLVTALCLDKLDIEYKLYERANTLKEVGAGIWLSPNALQVLEWINLELLEEIQDKGNTFNRILVADHKLNPISDSNQQFVKEKFGYTTMAIHRGKLQKILYSYLMNDNIIFGKEFKEATKNNEESYRVKFSDSTSVLTRSIIGADGIKSTLRKQLFPKSRIRYTGQTCWRGVSNFELDEKLASVGFTLWGKKLQFGVSRLEEGKTYWFAVALSKSEPTDHEKTLKSQLTEMYSEFHTVVNELIQNTPSDKIIRGDLSDLELLEKWNFEKICLIGDSAHSMTPDLGQGGAQAIEDAFYLSNFIKNSKNYEKAFDEFFFFRKSKVQKLVKQSRFTSEIAMVSKPLEIIRNFILKHTPEKIIQKQMIDLYEVHKTESLLQ